MNYVKVESVDGRPMQHAANPAHHDELNAVLEQDSDEP
jgi:hypothetical protein